MSNTKRKTTTAILIFAVITIRRAADTSKLIEAVSTAQGTQLSLLGDKGWATQRWDFKPANIQTPSGSLTTNQAKVVAEAKKWIGSNKLPGGTDGYYKCQAWVYQVVYRALGINAVDVSRATAKESSRCKRSIR